MPDGRRVRENARQGNPIERRDGIELREAQRSADRDARRGSPGERRRRLVNRQRHVSKLLD